MKVGELRRRLAQVIAEGGNEEATATARYIMEEVTGWTRTEIEMRSGDEIDETMGGRIEDVARRVAQGEPVQYAMSYGYFRGIKIGVERGVLIPRQETEDLVQLFKDRFFRAGSVTGVADVCTGSGCIAIAVKSEMGEGVRVLAIDKEEVPLRVANENAERVGVDIEVEKMDVLAEEARLPEWVDVVLCNPPYVMESERASMSMRVVEYEPGAALFVDDGDPLVFYGAVVKMCGGRERRIIFEINEALGKEMTELLEGLGCREVEIVKDFCGKDRFAVCVTA
ncbi:MAG: peptide chain release factor N(5)-glutamine methyltransferase [Bacteroidales bacterium]|nr:peptide chain release factor N(5)-glutamine methyltransferase [Bacteroidales bacterium]